MPIASVRQFIEFAVNMPAQLPHVGHALFSRSSSRSSLTSPTAWPPTAVNTVSRSTCLPSQRPASIGPPETTTVGRSRRAAAMSMPGMILSQLGMSTTASKACAETAISTESAITSRLASENFMPSWPMAMPSQTPMVEISRGVPPAMRTPVFTASATRSMPT